MGHATSFFPDAWRASFDVKARHFFSAPGGGAEVDGRGEKKV